MIRVLATQCENIFLKLSGLQHGCFRLRLGLLCDGQFDLPFGFLAYLKRKQLSLA
jgi:hypothetical protein